LPAERVYHEIQGVGAARDAASGPDLTRSAGPEASICRPFASLRAGSEGRRYFQIRTLPIDGDSRRLPEFS